MIGHNKKFGDYRFIEGLSLKYILSVITTFKIMKTHPINKKIKHCVTPIDSNVRRPCLTLW